MAYGDTNVFDLGTGMQSVAMVFQRVGGLWKLATAVNHPDGGSGWPALCTQGTPPATPPVLAPGSYTSDLARVLTSAVTGAAQTAATASPFAVNDFLAGSGSIPAQFATSIRQDQHGGVSYAGRFAPAPDPTFALPLANGRGYWVIGILTQSASYSAPAGLRAKDWPDGNQVATPRPAVVHHETDTFTTTYTAIDPLRSDHATVGPGRLLRLAARGHRKLNPDQSGNPGAIPKQAILEEHYRHTATPITSQSAPARLVERRRRQPPRVGIVPHPTSRRFRCHAPYSVKLATRDRIAENCLRFRFGDQAPRPGLDCLEYPVVVGLIFP